MEGSGAKKKSTAHLLTSERARELRMKQLAEQKIIKEAERKKAERKRKKEEKAEREKQATFAGEMDALLSGDISAETIQELKPIIDKNLKQFLLNGTPSEKLQLTKEALKYVYGEKEEKETVFNVIFRINKDITPLDEPEIDVVQKKKPKLDEEYLPAFVQEGQKKRLRNAEILDTIDQTAEEVAVKRIEKRIDKALQPDIPADPLIEDAFLRKVHASRNNRLLYKNKELTKTIEKLQKKIEQLEAASK